MKRSISVLLAVALLLCLFSGPPQVHASSKVTQTRAIAIVFDNSGSMYMENSVAWCRATYAMEVFASMLNAGDTLLIYPMNPIEVGSSQYTMEKPYCITDASQASTIREIYTPHADGTPMATIDRAAEGLERETADKKYMIVLTDGDTFDSLNKEDTVKGLNACFRKYASQTMTAMYLGIGEKAAEPSLAESEYFIKRMARNSEAVLSSLTEMCNLIFGRDTLPDNRINGHAVEFDISMSKLIVFVQGENISGLSVSGQNGAAGKKVSETTTKYSEKGSNYGDTKDTSLQGMMVTYTDCTAGTYTIHYTGTATSVEVYYEPDAELDFVFTDAEGNTVDPKELYEGEYKVSFGMKDGTTGELISSDLLGDINYRGSYFINGTEYPIECSGHSGEVRVPLKVKDTFDANLTVTYLSGYTISKDSSDFGWPSGGIQVVTRLNLKVELVVPDDYIVIPDLSEYQPMTARLLMNGLPLTEEEFALTQLQVDCDGIEYALTPNPGDSSYTIQLLPTENLAEGNYTIKATATYTEDAERTCQAESTADITMSNLPLWLKWVIGLSVLLALLILAWIIAHIRVLPQKLEAVKTGSKLVFDGEPVPGAKFKGGIKGGKLEVWFEHNGNKPGLKMDIKAGKESYLYMPNKQRYGDAVSNSVAVRGGGTILSASVGGQRFVQENGKLERKPKSEKPIKMKHGYDVKYNGTMMRADGKERPFTATILLNVKKK